MRDVGVIHVCIFTATNIKVSFVAQGLTSLYNSQGLVEKVLIVATVAVQMEFGAQQLIEFNCDNNSFQSSHDT